MSNVNVINEKKKALLAYKEKILEEIKYYERCVEDFPPNQNSNTYFEDVYSSDSEDEFPCAIDTGPTIPQLKLQQAMLKTCLHATQELTSLMVLQSEVNVLLDEPTFEGEKPVTEGGTWKEVTAECRIDLVPFTITFFMHTPSSKFGPPSYRGLRVVPVKYAHEMELAKSVLHTLKLPSDAVEVLRSYAVSHRSRRTTLARLANKYANSLFMEPHPEGGFVLKCADLLEVSWRLENKWSPVAPFHHRMKFDLEYMDETHIKTITQAHKQLLDPSIDTDERTLLLAKIITTCLEVRGPIDSDLESKTTERDDKRDNEIEKRDSEVMAPPKSLPKKPKKSKESNVGQKRSIEDNNDDQGAKRLKNNDVLNDDSKKTRESEGPKKSTTHVVNSRKTKSNDVTNDAAKRSKLNDVSDKNVNKVASSKNVKEPDNTKNRDGNTKQKNTKEMENNENGDSNQTKNKKTKEPVNKDNIENIKPKNKNVKESKKNVDGDDNIKDKIVKDNAKNKNVKEAGKTDNSENNINNKENANNIIKSKTKNVKESDNTAEVTSKNKPVTKLVKETGNNVQGSDDAKYNNKESGIAVQNKENIKIKNKISKDPSNIEHGKPKNAATKPTVTENNKDDNMQPKNTEKKTKNNTQPKNLEKNKDDNTQPKNLEKNKDTNIQHKNLEKNKDANTQPKTLEKNKDGTQPKNLKSNKDSVAKLKTSEKVKNSNTELKSIEKKKIKAVATPKNIENANSHKETENNPPINTDSQKKATVKKSNVANVKTSEINSNKNVNIPKTATFKAKESVANAKNDNQIKKVPTNVKKSSDNINLKPAVSLTKTDTQTVKKFTERNATNPRLKDKISPISKVVENDKTFVKQPTQPKKTEINNMSKPIKNITQKVASHRNTLKMKNSQNNFKPGNILKGNTKKENTAQIISKIPQKKMSPISESSARKNLLRVSPRQIPSKFKSLSQESFKQKMIKTTNIPRLMKKPTSTTKTTV